MFWGIGRDVRACERPARERMLRPTRAAYPKRSSEDMALHEDTGEESLCSPTDAPVTTEWRRERRPVANDARVAQREDDERQRRRTCWLAVRERRIAHRRRPVKRRQLHNHAHLSPRPPKPLHPTYRRNHLSWPDPPLTRTAVTLQRRRTTATLRTRAAKCEQRGSYSPAPVPPFHLWNYNSFWLRNRVLEVDEHKCCEKDMHVEKIKNLYL